MDEQQSKKRVNRVHGSIIGSRLAFAEKRWGKDGKQTLVDRLPLKERQLVDSVVFENNWFEFSILELLDRTIFEKLAGGDTGILHALGRFSAEYNYRRLPPQLINQSPDDVFKNASRINVLFQDFGEFQFEMINDSAKTKSAALIYRYPEAVPISYCASALGYFERLLELLGFCVVKVTETQCQSRGDDTHRYEISWQVIRVAEPTTAPQQRVGATGRLGATGSLSGTSTVSGAGNSTQSGSQSGASQSGTSRLKSGSQQRPQVVSGVDSIAAPPGPKWFNWRVKVLIVLITLASLAGIFQLIFSFIFATRESVSNEKIYSYACVGSIKPSMLLDRPIVRLKINEPWTNVKIVTEENGKKFTYSAKAIPANTNVELSLGEFISADSKALNAENYPANISINAIVDKQLRSCLCRLEK